MNPNIIEAQALRFIHYRLEKKLPIKTKDGEKYFRDRFYWIVHKFKEQYFIGGEKINTDSLLDKMFSLMKSGVGKLDLGKLHDFKIALACCMVAAANSFNCSIKVATEFFQDQFLRVVQQRFRWQCDLIIEHEPFLSNVLVNAGVDQNKAMKVIEAGVIIAETYPEYNYSSNEFLTKVIGGIVKECDGLEIAVTPEMLISDEFKRTLRCD